MIILLPGELLGQGASVKKRSFSDMYFFHCQEGKGTPFNHLKQKLQCSISSGVVIHRSSYDFFVIDKKLHFHLRRVDGLRIMWDFMKRHPKSN